LEEDGVINSVEGSREVKKNKGRDFSLIGGEEKVILDAE
jgi:hypothetical protein